MRILVAVDGSTESQLAVDTAAAQRWPAGTAVRAVSVWQMPYVLAASEGLGGIAFQQVGEQLEAAAKRATGAAVEALKRVAQLADAKVRQGDPKREIVAEAEEWGADLILLGSQGRTGIDRFLLGSVAEYVVRHAPCSVEVTRIPRRSAERLGESRPR